MFPFNAMNFIYPMPIGQPIRMPSHPIKQEDPIDQTLIKEEFQDESRRWCDGNHQKQLEQSLIEELKLSNIYTKKKHWSKEQDQYLVKLFEKRNLDWNKISERIQNTNDKICQRRYIRIKVNTKNWSRQEEEKIVHLRQVQKKKWKEISQIIKNHSSKQIRERYLNFLKSGINQDPWTFEQDVKIFEAIKRHGKKWKILETIVIGRSENQIKNRYNGTLKFIEKKAKEKIGVKKQEIPEL